MIPRNNQPTGQYDLLKKRTDEVVHKNHPLVILSKVIDWDIFDKSFGEKFHPDNGRPGLSTRLMAGLTYIQYAKNLSDEALLEGFVENPQWQYFCGLEYYTDKAPCDRSSLTRWRQRMGKDKLQLLLKETLNVAKRGKLLKRGECKTVVVDTTIMEKDIAFPTDSRLYFKALQSLVRYCKKSEIKLRQTYKRKAKGSLFKQARLAHLRKIKQAQREQKKLKTYLGRVIRDIQRKAPDWKNKPSLKRLLEVSQAVFDQKRNDKDKIYSVHEPKVKCYSKGKAHKRYEFGSKVSVTVTSKSCWVLGVKSFTKSVHDALTLRPALLEVENLIGVSLKRVFVDKGYRGQKHHPEGMEVCVSGQNWPSLYYRRLARRRNSVEAVISHLKWDCRMGRNFLHGEQGDEVNAVLSGVGHNLRKLMKELSLSPNFFVLFFKRFCAVFFCLLVRS